MSDFSSRAVQYVCVQAGLDGANTVVASPGPGRAILVLGYQLRVIGASPGLMDVRSLTTANIHLVLPSAVDPGVAVEYAGVEEAAAFKVDEDNALVVVNGAGVDTTGHITIRIVQA